MRAGPPATGSSIGLRTAARNRARSEPIAVRALASLGLALAASACSSPAQETISELERVERANHALRLQVELAKSSEPYLLLDLAALRLRLFQGAALLREFPVLAVETGQPTLMFVARSSRVLSADRAWKLLALDPPRSFTRTELVPPREGEPPPEPVIPPEPEEACPAPERYFLRFEDGLSVEILQDTSTKAGWKLRDFAEAAPWHDAFRVRIRLARDDAGALYRSLPLSASLVFSPGTV